MIESKKIRKACLLGYLLVSLPLFTAFCVDSHVRTEMINQYSKAWAKLGGVQLVFCGDSLTREGSNWGWRLMRNPFSAVNLAVSGSRASQILPQLSKAAHYSPETVYLLAGTNDILHRDFYPERFRKDYTRLLKAAQTADYSLVVILIPHMQKHADEVRVANIIIRDLCAETNTPFIDLNPTLAPQHTLLDQFTSDGVHFTKEAYFVWAEAIRQLSSGD